MTQEYVSEFKAATEAAFVVALARAIQAAGVNAKDKGFVGCRISTDGTHVIVFVRADGRLIARAEKIVMSGKES